MTFKDYKANYLKPVIYNKAVYLLIGYKHQFCIKAREVIQSFILLDKNNNSVLTARIEKVKPITEDQQKEHLHLFRI